MTSQPTAADAPGKGGPATPADDPSNVARLLSFWFDHDHPEGLAKWFKPSPAADAECEPWIPLVEAARAGALDAWARTPDGTLALLLLLDQVPRNVYRGTSAAYASEGAAFDRQMFFYLPLMHAAEAMLA
ncbi:uncharacterized protein F4807DRAFT_295630 [Annulohypoxylon truncatum]|uniref:uncharacterized protein n=1 Tax=Annulohypoxylon truncatum TaxID=327061 RepID=UPI0020075AFD|nr:uncharacterized protein F4807DRAFT_295630 [Annulohypoxylon truncatum]KAI1205091.1 hypothetical protein F4807DRAFT_295630 [Annulohypoxylon truncatum]